jgi:hypothetical protein
MPLNVVFLSKVLFLCSCNRTGVSQPFLSTAHQTLISAFYDTPQNFALREGDIKQYMDTKMRVLYVNP